MPQLPNWTDAQSIASYLTSILTFLLSIVLAFHPDFKEPALVQAIVPAVSLIVAGIAQAVNIITHRAAVVAAYAARSAAAVPAVPTVGDN